MGGGGVIEGQVKRKRNNFFSSNPMKIAKTNTQSLFIDLFIFVIMTIHTNPSLYSSHGRGCNSHLLSSLIAPCSRTDSLLF